MTVVLYIIEALFLAAAVGLLILYPLCRDPGYLIMAVLVAATAILSFRFLAVWPLILGGSLAGLLLFYGTGRT